MDPSDSSNPFDHLRDALPMIPPTSPRLSADPQRPSLFSSGSSPNRTPTLSFAEGSSHANSMRVPAASPPVPLSTLAPPVLSDEQRQARTEDEIRATVHRRRIPRAEKDADDPTTPVASGRNAPPRRESTTFTTLNRLFAVQTGGPSPASRSTSYIASADGNARLCPPESAAAVADHLFTQGLLSGKHSDIVVHAFGCGYRLHRLILDRAPFFSTALSGQWLESNSREITVHPQDIDNNITQACFELALKRLYGASVIQEEDTEAVGLFATGCWLEMKDLIDSSVRAILRQMTPQTLSPLIRLVTNSYYGRAGDKILASAKAMLCRDGWKMPLRFWDSIPSDIIREIVGGDGFFISSEWDRWVLARRLLDRRLRMAAIDAGLVKPGTREVLRAPDAMNLTAVRFNTVYRRNSISSVKAMPESVQRWISLYTHPDVEPLLVLIDEGIHYVHLDFEHLQYMRVATDILGLPMMSDKVISNALWMQMELRQKVLNAEEHTMELGVSQLAEDIASPSPVSRETTMAMLEPTSPAKDKHKAVESTADDKEPPSMSWDGNGKPRKFWIPSADCNILMGGNEDPVIATTSPAAAMRQPSRLSATIQPEDVQWAADFGAASADTRPLTQHVRPGSSGGPGGQQLPAPTESRPVAYSHFPPFRFAVEFPNPRLVKERKRVYSRPVFYAGSIWNIYIQKVRSSKNPQLGVYLHRVKEGDAGAGGSEDGDGAMSATGQRSVDERIGQLERGLMMHADRNAAYRRRRQLRDAVGDMDLEAGGESSGSADPDVTLVGRLGGPSDYAATNKRSDTLDPSSNRNSTSSEFSALIGSDYSSDEDDNIDFTSPARQDKQSSPEFARLSSKARVPTLPPYTDARPTIKTYFKIYSPSRAGRMLSVYESAPDKFNFSQSWGWKSSTLMLDDGVFGDGEGEGMPPASAGREDGDGGKTGVEGRVAGKRDGGGLKFMVVIGNV